MPNEFNLKTITLVLSQLQKYKWANNFKNNYKQ